MAEGVQEDMLGLGGVEEKTIAPVDPINDLGFIPAKDNQGFTGFFDPTTKDAYIDGILYRLERYTDSKENTTELRSRIISVQSVISRENLDLEYVEVMGERYNITGICIRAFTESAVKSIILGDSVEWIGESAFEGCCLLESITFGKRVTFIPTLCCSMCERLADVKFLGHVMSINHEAFAYCGGLKSIAIPDSVYNIEPSAFFMCDGIKSITFPESVSIIQNRTLTNSDTLETIYIKSDFVNIHIDAFAGCKNIKDIYCVGHKDNVNIYDPFDYDNRNGDDYGKWIEGVKWHYGWDGKTLKENNITNNTNGGEKNEV